MRLRELESALGEVETFSEPKVEFEQYPTSAHLAARMIHTAEELYGDIEGRCVGDLGCGGGILAIGASIMDAGHVIAVDIDADVLHIAAQNVVEMEVDVDLIHADVTEITNDGSLALLGGKRVFDTVVMNPPFGTRVKGVDMVFLRAALSLARTAVYSLHKTSTREFIHRKAKEWKVKAFVVAEMRFDVPRIYRFHSQRSKDIAVDFWRLEPIERSTRR